MPQLPDGTVIITVVITENIISADAEDSHVIHIIDFKLWKCLWQLQPL
jgi:hypothetical protein